MAGEFRGAGAYPAPEDRREPAVLTKVVDTGCLRSAGEPLEQLSPDVPDTLRELVTGNSP